MTLASSFGVIAFTAFVWWFATGVVLCLGRRPEGWHGVVMLCLSVPAALSLGLAWALRDEASVAGALAGYLAAVLLWAWHEAAFLLGYSTGPNRGPCPAGVGRATRFRLAWEALRDHEMALLATVLLLAVMLHGAPNALALHAFAALWVCRIAAKLCIFEGVPAMATEMMPERLRYLQTYFGDRPPGVAFGLVVALLGAATAWLARGAAEATSMHAAVAHALLATTVGLALVEHLFLVLPVRDGRLWAWAMGFAREPEPAVDSAIKDDGNEGRAAPDTRREAGAHAPRPGRRLHGVALRPRAVVARGRAP